MHGVVDLKVNLVCQRLLKWLQFQHTLSISMESLFLISLQEHIIPLQ